MEWMGICKFAGGTFTGLEGDAIDGVFGAMLGNPGEMALWMVLTVLAGFLVCSFGLQKGLERITKVMMLGLLCLIVVLAVHSLLLPGAGEGVKFYLLPDFGRAKEAGLGSVITAAMNQAFFTLSLGIAAMEIFGSYMSKDHTLTGESVRICCLDTFVALMSGLIIFPACFSFGVEPNAGPALIFTPSPAPGSSRLWTASTTIRHIRPAGLHLGKNVIQHGIFVHHGGIGRQHFRVDIAGRRCQQKSDPAGVALGKVCDGTDIFPQLLLSIRTDGKQLGEHPAIFAV